jgi:hypothetical protein
MGGAITRLERECDETDRLLKQVMAPTAPHKLRLVTGQPERAGARGLVGGNRRWPGRPRVVARRRVLMLISCAIMVTALRGAPRRSALGARSSPRC